MAVAVVAVGVGWGGGGENVWIIAAMGGTRRLKTQQSNLGAFQTDLNLDFVHLTSHFKPFLQC